MPPTWTKIVSQLCDQLQENQEKLSLLQEIDKATLSADTTIDQLADKILRSVKGLARLSRAGFYIFAKAELLPVATTDLVNSPLLPSPVIPPHLEAGDIVLLRPSDAGGGFLPALGCQTALVSPVFGEGQRPLGLLAFESDQLPILGHLEMPELCELISAVSRQFSIAINFKERLRSESIRWQIIGEILDNDLKPGIGFTTIAKHIPALLPVFRATLLEPAPSVQIIIHRDGDAHMTIVATTGHEPVNTRVLTTRSVCGHLIQEDRDSINIDPRTDPVYRSYLGHEMRSEFAFRLRVSDGVSAIINLETPQEEAFKELHARFLVRGCRHLIPLIKGLYFRRDRTQMQQRAILYALDQHLSGLAASIQHALSGPLAAARTAADEIISICERAQVGLDPHAIRLTSRISALAGITESLAQDVVGFSHNEGRSVRDLLLAARLLTMPESLRPRRVEIEVHAGADYEVFCSLFLKEIFHNIMANAVYWIQQRQQDEPDHRGLLEVFLEQEQPTVSDELDRAINRRVKIVFRDNGTGMSDDDFQSIAERGFTRRDAGSGFGLFAGKEYVTSLGGEMLFQNEPDKAFEVTVILPEHNPSLKLQPEPAIGRFTE